MLDRLLGSDGHLWIESFVRNIVVVSVFAIDSVNTLVAPTSTLCVDEFRLFSWRRLSSSLTLSAESSSASVWSSFIIRSSLIESSIIVCQFTSMRLKLLWTSPRLQICCFCLCVILSNWLFLKVFLSALLLFIFLIFYLLQMLLSFLLYPLSLSLALVSLAFPYLWGIDMSSEQIISFLSKARWFRFSFSFYRHLISFYSIAVQFGLDSLRINSSSFYFIDVHVLNHNFFTLLFFIEFESSFSQQFQDIKMAFMLV